MEIGYTVSLLSCAFADAADLRLYCPHVCETPNLIPNAHNLHLQGPNSWYRPSLSGRAVTLHRLLILSGVYTGIFGSEVKGV